MMLYCDESGGVGAGVMLLAAVAIERDAADALLDRARDVLGLRGELKGSRIDIAQRAFIVELFARMGGRAVVTHVRMGDLQRPNTRAPSDLAIYTALLETAIDTWLPETGGCADIIIDDGRYDDVRNGHVRDEIQAKVGQWGRATLSDSRLSPGVQIADVIANSHFHIAVNGRHTRRVQALLDPFWQDHTIRHIRVEDVTG